MGGNLQILLKFGVVGITKDWEFSRLLNHLQTNENFDLITGFDFNRKKGFIWLDTISEPLKAQLKNDWNYSKFK
jgi:hypothetical protein